MAESDPSAFYGAQTPYYFLSYGRTPPVEGDDRHPDQSLIRFHKDLSRHIMQMTDLREGISPGYLDRRTALGSHWSNELRTALATCQVLVPVYSPRYVTSAWCDWERRAFELRQQQQRARGTFTRNAVVPVVWIPMDHTTLPSDMREVQYLHDGLGQDYERHGLYFLIERDRRQAYKQVTLNLARTVVEAARASRLAPCETALFNELGGEPEEAA